MTPRVRAALLLAAGVAAGVLLVDVAEARVGGGQGYSSGRSSGGSSSGGGGGIEGEVLYLLIRLVIAYPQIGVPLIVVVGVGWWWSQRQGTGGGEPVVFTTHHTGVGPSGTPRHARRAQVDRLAEADPGFSEPVLLDFVQLVVRRAWAARHDAGRQAALRPFVAPDVQRALDGALPRDTTVQDVILGSLTVDGVAVGRDGTTLTVALETVRIQVADGQESSWFATARWTFRRDPGARSLPPEDVHRLGCPSCGAAVQTDDAGRCTNCGTAITAGQRQWQAVAIQLGTARPVEPPTLSTWGQATEEPGYRMSTVEDPDLAAQTRAFAGRHPDFDAEAWTARVHTAFTELQAAWSVNDAAGARPYCTDAAWNTLRFWMERYRRHGLRNRVEDVEVERVRVVRVTIDAWYEAITVRIWARCRDWTEQIDDGRVVSGSKDPPRAFSEYWTLLRAVGTGASSGDARRCPSCGAPLDRIDAAGTCAYCDTVVTTGRHDWVLSRIEQPESYRG